MYSIVLPVKNKRINLSHGLHSPGFYISEGGKVGRQLVEEMNASLCKG